MISRPSGRDPRACRRPLADGHAAEIATAHLMRAHGLGLPGGQLVANPIPARPRNRAREIITPVIEAALAEATRQGIAAKAVTPFLLQRIFRTDRRAGRWPPISRWF